jgi:hypothetical protein
MSSPKFMSQLRTKVNQKNIFDNDLTILFFTSPAADKQEKENAGDEPFNWAKRGERVNTPTGVCSENMIFATRRFPADKFAAPTRPSDMAWEPNASVMKLVPARMKINIGTSSRWK